MKFEVHALRRRIVRERDQDQPRLARAASVQILQTVQKRLRIRHRQHAGVPFRHDDAVLMDRIRRIRRYHGIAGTDDREQQMRQRVLGADGGDRFGRRIEVHVIAFLYRWTISSRKRGMPFDIE